MLSDILDDKEISGISSHFDSARGRHPAWSTLNAYDQKVDYVRSPRDYLANGAVKLIRSEDSGKAWLKSVKPRLAQTADYEEAAAAVAEICCFGAMLKAGFAMQPIPTTTTPTPDFAFQLAGISGVVEVTAKLEHNGQVDRAKEIAAGKTPEGVERSSSSTAHFKAEFTVSEAHPFGAPDFNKVGDTTQTNAISRICAIKGKETQFGAGQPSLLWVDFRNLGKWPGVLSQEQASPLLLGHGGSLCSGAIWHGFYGWKGAPIFDDKGGGGFTQTPMAHDGRFAATSNRKSIYSGALLCLEQAVILYENPRATAPLTQEVRSRLTRLPWFDLEHSIADWQPGDIDREIAAARSMIAAIQSDRDQPL